MAHLVTGKVRLSYEHIWEPASINGSDEKYSVSFVIPKSDTKTVKAIRTQSNRRNRTARRSLAAEFRQI